MMIVCVLFLSSNRVNITYTVDYSIVRSHHHHFTKSFVRCICVSYAFPVYLFVAHACTNTFGHLAPCELTHYSHTNTTISPVVVFCRLSFRSTLNCIYIHIRFKEPPQSPVKTFQ